MQQFYCRESYLVRIMNYLLYSFRSSLLFGLVVVVLAYGPLHISSVSGSLHPQGLGRLNRDLIRRGGAEGNEKWTAYGPHRQAVHDLVG
jgi:hypothetical protein